jgi:BirA family transcriptional regulator, biotin operon repressor / biotin---[acetyl-CoA-carboxylase] ligase
VSGVTTSYGDLDRPPLHEDVLRKALVTPGSMWSTVDVVDTSPSTNAALAERAAGSRDDGVVLIAEHQTAGRGRLDRSWTAPPRSGVTMSVLVRPDDVPLASWPWIPLLSGLAVAATLRRDAEVEAALKWPNDVIVADRKVAGLLVERVESSRGRPAAVIGIGVNVSLRPEELPVPTATSLMLEGAVTTDRSTLVRGILRALEGLLTDWYRHGGRADAGLQTAYVDACSTLGRRVRLEHPDGGESSGEAVGIDDVGRLLVRTPDGQVAFGAGDVVHLR